jgi:hypothetical protein
VLVDPPAAVAAAPRPCHSKSVASSAGWVSDHEPAPDSKSVEFDGPARKKRRSR